MYAPTVSTVSAGRLSTEAKGKKHRQSGFDPSALLHDVVTHPSPYVTT